MKLSPAMKSYLQTIYFIHINKKQIHLNEIATTMCVTKASVNNAIKTLHAEGLLDYHCYRPIVLTNKGIELGKRLVENHNIIKKYLLTVLRVNKEEAEKETNAIEFIISQRVITCFKEQISLVDKHRFI